MKDWKQGDILRMNDSDFLAMFKDPTDVGVFELEFERFIGEESFKAVVHTSPTDGWPVGYSEGTWFPGYYHRVQEASAYAANAVDEGEEI